jgi:hypothetical protein
LLLAGCSPAAQQSSTPATTVASADDIARAAWECVHFMTDRRIADNETAAREGCERSYENAPKSFVHEYLGMYEAEHPSSDPALGGS